MTTPHQAKPGMKTRLIIPTVSGLAEVQSLQRTGSDEPNTISLQDFTRLAVSQEYDTFVRRPSGAIEQDFGHANWFMLISSRIESGKSWHLGTYLAHAFEARGALWMGAPETGAFDQQEQIVVATGAIQKTGMVVQKVGQVPEKLALAKTRLLGARSAGLRAVFLLPEANVSDIPPAMNESCRQAGIEIHGVSTVAQALEILGLEAAAAAATAWQGSPWPGLVSYTNGQRSVFFGRDLERQAALERMLETEARSIQGVRRAFLLVHGPSGVGKSSFVKAGLVADIIEGVPVGSGWQDLVLTFSGANDRTDMHVAQSILNSLRPAPGKSALGLAELMETPDRISDVLDAAGRGRLLLVLDQFEQALAGQTNESAQRLGTFLNGLCASGRVWIIATIRSGQLELLYRIPSLSSLAADARQFRLTDPTKESLSRIITGPAEAAGITFSPKSDGTSLAQALVDEASLSPDSLPLLQLALSRLYGYAINGAIGPAAYDRMRGLSGVVATSADEAVAKLAAEGIADATIDRLLAELVRIDSDTGDVLARTIPLPTAHEIGADPARVRIARHMIDTRLLVEMDEGDEARLRLAHEALFLLWPRLKDLVGKIRAEILLRDEIEAEAAKWKRAGRGTDLLRRTDARVSPARDLRDGGLLPLSPDALTFIARSISARKRDWWGRMLVGRVLPVMIAVVAVVAAFYLNALREEAIAASAAQEKLRIEADDATTAAENALLNGQKTAVQNAILLSRAEAAAGRPLEGLQVLVDALDPLPAADRPPEAADALALGLQKASQIKARGQLPPGTVFVQAGSEIWAHTESTGTLWLFGPDGIPAPVGGEALRDGRLADIKRLEGGDEIVIVWNDGLVERRRFDGNVIGPGRSFQAPPDKSDIAVNMRYAGFDADYGPRAVSWSWISPNGQVAIYSGLTPVNEFYVYNDDERIWLLDTQTGRSVHPTLPVTEFGGTFELFNTVTGDIALSKQPFSEGIILKPVFLPSDQIDLPSPPRDNSGGILTWAEILANTAPQRPFFVQRQRTDEDFVGSCRELSDAASLQNLGSNIAAYVETGGGFSYCGLVPNGILTISEEGTDSGYYYQLLFRTALGADIDLLKALPQYFTDVGDYEVTQLLRQYVTDAKTGLVALVIHDNLVVMRFNSDGILPDIVAELPFDEDSSLITVLDDQTLLLVTPASGRYVVRSLAIDTDASERLAVVSSLPTSALPLSNTLNKGDCISLGSPSPSSNLHFPNIFESGNSFIYECFSQGENFRVHASYDGIAFIPNGVSPEKNSHGEYIFADWITRIPASPAYVLSNGTVLAYHFNDKTVRLWSKQPQLDGGGVGWTDQVLLRAANRIFYIEPDANATRLLAAESGEVGLVMKLIDVASSEAMFSFGLARSDGATFAPDGTIVFAKGTRSGRDVRTYRLRTVDEMLLIAREKLAAMCGDAGCSAVRK